jgi:hypothetical protein
MNEETELKMVSAKNFERYLNTAGVTILIAAVASLVMPFSFDTGSRGFKAGAMAASISLEILWVIVAVVFAVTFWKVTTALFLPLVFFNGMVVCLVIISSLR